MVPPMLRGVADRSTTCLHVAACVGLLIMPFFSTLFCFEAKFEVVSKVSLVSLILTVYRKKRKKDRRHLF